MTNNTPKITVNFVGESEAQLPHNISLTESTISEKLNECFNQHKISIEEIIVRISVNKGQDEQYSCEISLVSSDVDFKHVESGKDYPSTVHQAIDKTVEFVRREKDKRV